MAQHRPRKPASVEYTTDEEDIIVYDMGEEIESPKNGSTAEELRASSVTAPRNALPKAVPEDEELGCGWLGGGDSFISRNPPWLWPWTVPGSTLWGFPQCPALKNLSAITLGPLEKCGNSWRGGGRMELEGIRVSQNMETNKENSVLPLMESNKIFLLPPLAVPSTGAILPPLLKNFSSSWADHVESSTPSNRHLLPECSN
ncbi:hypothetical protein TNCV_19441 [Trichonephila clavipes]|nr:hypothetical protein TNCV_19441 [Trichonephila clavipes]